MNTQLLAKDFEFLVFFIVVLFSFAVLMGGFYLVLDFLIPPVSSTIHDPSFFAQVNARNSDLTVGSILLPVIVIVLFQRYFLSEKSINAKGENHE